MQKKFIKKFLLCMVLFSLISIFFAQNVFCADDENFSIDSSSGVLMDLSSGKILYEKNMNEKRYPASLTKVLTAIVVLENCKLDDTATVSYDSVMSLSSGYVTANLQVGEELSVEQLLYVLMVGSSNDAAIVLAEHVAGSQEEFSNLMNEKAKEIGCLNSHFVNPNGVHSEDHYSTAYDLALIAKYAMQNEEFRKLVSTTSYKLPATAKYEREDRLFTTTNSLLIVNNNDRADNYYYKYATGIKTGFTTPAGNCLIASSNKDGFELLTVLLGGGQTSEGLSQRYLDTISMFNYGYSNYFMREVAKQGSVVQTTVINNATKDTKKLDLALSKNITVLIKQADKNTQLLPEVTLNENLKAPIKKGDIVGKIKYTVEGITYEADLMANSDVKPARIFLKILIFVIIVLFVILYLKSNKKRKKNKRVKYYNGR